MKKKNLILIFFTFQTVKLAMSVKRKKLSAQKKMVATPVFNFQRLTGVYTSGVTKILMTTKIENKFPVLFFNFN